MTQSEIQCRLAENRWDFNGLVRPSGFEPLTFGIGMQNNYAYIARAIV